jgi:hypothetical protein
MAAFGIPLIFAAYGLLMIGGLWLLIAAVSESFWWGVGALLLPVVIPIFVAVHWKVAKNPFLFNRFATGLLLGGMLLSRGLKK